MRNVVLLPAPFGPKKPATAGRDLERHVRRLHLAEALAEPVYLDRRVSRHERGTLPNAPNVG